MSKLESLDKGPFLPEATGKDPHGLLTNLCQRCSDLPLNEIASPDFHKEDKDVLGIFVQSLSNPGEWATGSCPMCSLLYSNLPANERQSRVDLMTWRSTPWLNDWRHCKEGGVIESKAPLETALLSFSGRMGLIAFQPDALSGPVRIIDEERVNWTLAKDWVDRYYINQSNNAEMAHQINQMDAIYRDAYVTIIAGAGHDPSYGLPGVTTRKMNAQAYAKIGNHFLISLKKDSYSAIYSTTWAQRGWTYQEAFFLCKKLVFTDEQLYFSCYTMLCCETLDYPLLRTGIKNYGVMSHKEIEQSFALER